jgi:uncharacterized protein (TIGR02996 family)
VRDADLLAEIAAAPHDAAPYLVYADAYLGHGDPRGELVVVQHALETAGAGAICLQRREAELLDEHLEAWLGPIGEHRDSLIVRWRRGFLAGARVRLRKAAADVAPLRALLDVPEAAAALVELYLGPNKAAAASCQPLLDELCARRPPALRRLHVGDGPLDEVWAVPSVEVDLDALAPLPLAALTVQASSITLRGRALPRLRELALRAPGLAPARLAEAGAWPALESLSLWCAAPGPLSRWLDPARFPRLRSLALDGAADADAVAAELRRLPIARQLDSIAITGGTLTEWGALALATLPGAVRLDLRRNNIGRSACAELARRPGALVEPQAGNVDPFTDPAALRSLRAALDRSAAEIWTRELGSGGDPDRAVVARYELGDARWSERKRLELVRTLPPGSAREVCLGLERRWRADLAPELRSDGQTVYRKLGEVCAQLGELDAAEAWQWRAHEHARWYGWGRDRDHLAEIAALRLRQDAVDEAIPLLDQLAASTEATRRARRSGLVLSIGFAELARGRLARAERVCRRANEIADATLATSETERAALAALLWARHDVESIARGAWLFAVRRRQLDPNARTDSDLHGPPPTEATAAAAARRTLAAFERFADAGGIALACALLGELAERGNQLAQAAGWIERALAAAPAGAAGALARAIAYGIRGRIALGRGELERARGDAREALAIHRAELHRLGEALQLLALADLELVAGRLDEAEERAGEALAQLTADAEFPAAAAAHLRLGQIAQLRRRRADAERRLRTAIACAERDRYLRERPARAPVPASGAPARPSAGLDPPAPPPPRELEVIGRAELWLAVLHGQDCRLPEAYRLLGRARARLHAGSPHAVELLATATAIVGRFAGSKLPLPDARSGGARAMRGLLA